MPCSRIRIVSALLCCCFFSLSSTANAQGDIAAGLNFGGGNPFRQIVVQKVQQELNCMKLVAKLSDDQADTILDNLDELIDEESAKITQAIQGGDQSAIAGDSKAIRDAIAVEAKAVLGAKELKAFNADLALRLKYNRRAAQRGVLANMDGLLQLSSEQQGEIAKLLMSEWKDEWNGLGMIGAQGGLFVIRGQIKALPQDKLKSALRDSQWAALEGMINLDQSAMVDQVGLAKLQGQAVSMLKLEELNELCDLTEDQSSKLEEALGAALTASVERKEDAMKALQGGGFQANMDLIADVSRPIDQMMFGDDAWTSAIDKVLKPGQAAKHKARLATRQKRNASATNAAMAAGLSMQAGGLTGKQMVALGKLFEERFAEPLQNPMKQAMQFAEIPDEDYQKILNDEQWGKLSAMFEMMRKQLDGNFADFPVEPPVAE